ncbi:MBL fold metallo-hydrolase RNA specificity domain-containing protein [Marinobacter similis]|uniref:MBL fold metallo-hydrolase RNA specificity domain-containing protein n=1 Tax=Marinobacter similis TaxID=1420916 RepID=UPI000AF248D9|nr:MBL fold metallo-hydrolase RNA specificity domain-containing protein [Marinobacter similis]
MATGSQGEPRTALRRLAMGSHPDFELEAGDTVIFSARAIPGNEEAIEALIDRLRAMGVTVITAEQSAVPIHASGHPAQEELQAMYQWVRPKIAIPVHGEGEHMDAHAQLAKGVGVSKTLVGRNGDLFMIRPVPGMRRQIAETGRLGWDKQELVRVE